MKQETVLYEVNNQIATITLNRPNVKNALNDDMHHELFESFKEAERDSDVSVIVLQGAGDAFCSGADLKSASLNDRSAFDYGDSLRETYNRLILTITQIQKPIIAHINGIAVGAGLSIALACDFRVAAYDAKMALSFLNIGLVPDAGASYFLPRIVGYAKALELGLGQMISAEEAYRINLINQIGSPEELAKQLTETPLEAFGLMKSTMRESYEHSLPEILEKEVHAQRLAGQTEDHTKAVQRFLTKRS
ncbi:enoyl-CoA hydratase [Bacillaceae bacterium JMAK1]|nr:enoyl-CoA hydratase [Bacillaceae bacterium JMAK1]